MNALLDSSAWDDAVKAICGDFEIRYHRDIPFAGNIQLRDMGGLEVAHIQTNARHICRTSRASDDDRFYFLILQTTGRMGFQDCKAEEMALRPGEIALIDSAREFTMFPDGLVNQVSVHLPRHLLNQRHSSQEPVQKLPVTGASSHTLRSVLQQLRFMDPDIPASARDGNAILQAIVSLLPSALDGPQPDQSSMRLVAEQAIRRLLNDHQLCPELLSKEMGVSRRTLYRLFEGDSESIAQHILRLRLEQACAELQNPGNRSLSITDIAYRWGFSDVTQFSRAFKRHIGDSPRDYRRMNMIDPDHRHTRNK